jgi:hypothetical protein
LAPVAGSVQLAASKLPASPAAFEKLTVPEGRIPVPAAELSATVAVHVLAWLITTDAGLQLTVVELDRFVAVTVSSSLLVKWLSSPP